MKLLPPPYIPTSMKYCIWTTGLSVLLGFSISRIYHTLFLSYNRPHRRMINTKEKAKVVDAVWGPELLEFLAALEILHQDVLKNGWRVNTWRNGCFGKMDDHLVHTIPNHHQLKMDVFSKSFTSIHPCCKITTACGIQVRPPNNSGDLYLLFCQILLKWQSGTDQNISRRKKVKNGDIE